MRLLYFGGHEVHAILVAFPILESAGVPIGEVSFGDVVWEGRVGGFFEALDDLGVGEAIGEEFVDEIAEFAGEASDFAGAASFSGSWGRVGDWQHIFILHEMNLARGAGQRLSRAEKIVSIRHFD
jgi:hypothetical protein